MTSETPVGCVCQVGVLLLRPVGGVPRSLWWLPSSSGCTARGVSVTGRGLGVLEVGGAFVQYAQPLASRSRPSWSRPTRGKTRANSGRGQSRTMTTGPQRRRRAGNGGVEPVTEAPVHAVRAPDSLLRGLVSTALTLTGPTSMFPAGIIGILRFFFGVRLRRAFNVSTLDARTSSPTAPHRPRPHRLQGLSPPPGPRTLEEAARRRRPCAPRVRGGSGPDGAPASLGVPAGHRARR
ncbi:Uncharacterised protein [Actinomyces naeslundii]|nr:Uncharacterised protein [Actinomyces naeslundii]